MTKDKGLCGLEDGEARLREQGEFGMLKEPLRRREALRRMVKIVHMLAKTCTARHNAALGKQRASYIGAQKVGGAG